MLPLEKIPFTLVSGEAWEKGGPLEPNREQKPAGRQALQGSPEF